VFAETVGQALSEDLSDLADAGQVTRLVLRMLLAAGLGALLGWQREKSGKDAGLRTHMLVAVGSAAFLFVPQQMNMPPADLSRVIQGLIAGIGFLGAGAILKSDEQQRVQGLTTAAGIWLTAAIGMAAGLGRDLSAILLTVVAFVILEVLLRLEQRIAPQKSDKDRVSI
jgi:putative Mg2+ transporter-C (MgtC) family protein